MKKYIFVKFLFVLPVFSARSFLYSSSRIRTKIFFSLPFSLIPTVFRFFKFKWKYEKRSSLRYCCYSLFVCLPAYSKSSLNSYYFMNSLFFVCLLIFLDAVLKFLKSNTTSYISNTSLNVYLFFSLSCPCWGFFSSFDTKRSVVARHQNT